MLVRPSASSPSASARFEREEQRGAGGDRVASRLIEPEKSNEEPKATELRTKAEPGKVQRGADGDRVASLNRTWSRAISPPMKSHPSHRAVLVIACLRKTVRDGDMANQGGRTKGKEKSLML